MLSLHPGAPSPLVQLYAQHYEAAQKAGIVHLPVDNFRVSVLKTSCWPAMNMYGIHGDRARWSSTFVMSTDPVTRLRAPRPCPQVRNHCPAPSHGHQHRALHCVLQVQWGHEAGK